MKIRNRTLGVAALAAIATICASSSVQAAMLDSAAFNHRYEGDNFGAQLTGTNSTFNVNAGEVPTWNPLSGGGILDYQNTILDSGAWFDSLEWDTDVNNAVGWTVEFRIKIGTDGDEDPAFAAFQWFGKENGSSTSTRRAGLGIGKNKVYISSLNTTPVDTSDNTDDFHVFRIAQPANSSNITVWRDGVQIFDGLSRTGNNSGLDMWWGDGSSGYGGPSVSVDYFRWDSTGPFEPVPEPSSIMLAALSLAFWSKLISSRKRARRGA
jgi:hypothetical protein